MEPLWIFDYPNIGALDITWFLGLLLLGITITLILTMVIGYYTGSFASAYIGLIITLVLAVFIVLTICYIIVVGLKHGWAVVQGLDLILVILSIISLTVTAKVEKFSIQKCETVTTDGRTSEVCRKINL